MEFEKLTRGKNAKSNNGPKDLSPRRKLKQVFKIKLILFFWIQNYEKNRQAKKTSKVLHKLLIRSYE